MGFDTMTTSDIGAYHLFPDLVGIPHRALAANIVPTGRTDFALPLRSHTDGVASSRSQPPSLRTKHRMDSSSSMITCAFLAIDQFSQSPAHSLSGRARLVLRARAPLSRRSPRKCIQGQRPAPQRDRTLPPFRPLGHAAPLAVPSAI